MIIIGLRSILSVGYWKVESTLSKLEDIAKNDPHYIIDKESETKIYEVRDAALEAIRKLKAK